MIYGQLFLEDVLPIQDKEQEAPLHVQGADQLLLIPELLHVAFLVRMQDVPDPLFPPVLAVLRLEFVGDVGPYARQKVAEPLRYDEVICFQENISYPSRKCRQNSLGEMLGIGLNLKSASFLVMM